VMALASTPGTGPGALGGGGRALALAGRRSVLPAAGRRGLPGAAHSLFMLACYSCVIHGIQH
jgi:hypothetical protein